MKKASLNDMELHSAGAIVQHASPFEYLKEFSKPQKLDKTFLEEWVLPYYMNIGRTDTAWITHLIEIKEKITAEVIENNLGDFNWRTRQTGAFFAALTNQKDFIEIIGVHLLKSEVCFAGQVYCTVLAYFNTQKSLDYLNKYLEYYLGQPTLWFDQRSAMEAVAYLDKINGTKHLEKHNNMWLKFIKNKPNWKPEIETLSLESQLEVIKAVAN